MLLKHTPFLLFAPRILRVRFPQFFPVSSAAPTRRVYLVGRSPPLSDTDQRFGRLVDTCTSIHAPNTNDSGGITMATLWHTKSLRLFILVALVGSLLLLSGNAAEPVQAQTTLPRFNLVNNAVMHQDRLGLTIHERMQTGAAWLPTKQPVQDGFTAEFQWQINRLTQRGAEGFALVIHNADTLPFPEIALGEGRHGLGYQGIPNSLAVEFDTQMTPAADFGQGSRGDPNDNHISIQTRGQEPNNADTDFSLGYTTQTEPGIPFFADGQRHTTKVVYKPGNIAVFVDDMTTPRLHVAVDLASVLRLADGKAWVGLTAATGRRFEAHDIYTFTFTPTNEAQ
jgi:hypothetical protein